MPEKILKTEGVSAPSKPTATGKSNAQKIKEVENWILHEIERKNGLDDGVRKQTVVLNQMKSDIVKKKVKIDENIVSLKIRWYDLKNNNQ